jgi:hypothetical protein
MAELRVELDDVLGRIATTEQRAQRLGTRVEASRRAGRSEAITVGAEAERAAAVEELTVLRQQAEDLRVTIADTDAELARAERGDVGDPRAHLRFVAHPQDPGLTRRSWILDVWSAVGIAAAVVLLGALLVVDTHWWWIGLVAVLAGYVAIEALVRRRFLVLLLNVSVLLAVIAAVILVASYLPLTIAIVLLVFGVLILRDNVRELRTSMRRE